MYTYGKALFTDCAVALLVPAISLLIAYIIRGIFDITSFRLDFAEPKLNVNRFIPLNEISGWFD